MAGHSAVLHWACVFAHISTAAVSSPFINAFDKTDMSVVVCGIRDGRLEDVYRLVIRGGGGGSHI